MHKKIAIFEVEGGSDKGFNGHRKDTVPIADAIEDKGWSVEILYYRPEWSDELVEYCTKNFDGIISRVNPGSIPGGESGYCNMLRRAADNGLIVMSHPDEMLTFGAKDALVKLVGTGLVPEDTFAYYDIDTFKKTFPISLSYGERVLKQNRGSTGEGIWRVVVDDDLAYSPGDSLPLNTKLRCTEAVDNHVEEFILNDFMTFCEQYIVGDNGMLVDMKFMPRIVEGEIRIFMVGSKPLFVVHKVPANTKDAFSATLFSGAQYTYDKPEKWQTLIDLFRKELPTVLERLDVKNLPLIWTADFMLADAPDGGDDYVLGEINCSCVGFTSQLDVGIQDVVADEVVNRIEAANA